MPPESVAVTVNRRWDGYSWSGAVNEPVRVPLSSWMMCEWQSPPGQCIISNVQLNAAAPSVPSCASEPVALKLIVSPTRHVSPFAGAVMVTDGGEFPGSIWREVSSDRPNSSVTRRPTLKGPALVYVRLIVTPVPSSYAPSPSRSHAYVSVSSFGSVVSLASKWMVSGNGPNVGVALKRASGGWFGPYQRIRRISSRS